MNSSKPLDNSSSSEDSANVFSPQRPPIAPWGSTATTNSSISSISDMNAPKKTLKSAITDGSALQAMVKGKNASRQAGTQAYPAVEISMRDTSKTQAMEAMRHIERSRPGLTSGATPRISLDPTGSGT